ncbi:18019_t:CDS:2 [Acaulospora morrowiae]|uniref:18019_t:CDS:1 n=1 Tax=Acaulospora morrowiae TaxID=94023 RepID=A0A9N9BR26_9GLOM|nr:18019_t:CDS:2 [Acaulospora morrowiae]
MSFGRPPNTVSYAPSPPERGSFPLDHDGSGYYLMSMLESFHNNALHYTSIGECKHLIKEYLRCLRQNSGDNGNCKNLSKAYLKCRMEKGLMAHDEMRNLGFQDDDNENDSSNKIAKDSNENS